MFFLPLIFYNYSRVIVAATIKSKRPVYLKSFMLGLFSFLKNINAFAKDRYHAQKNRKVGDLEIVRRMISSNDFVRKLHAEYPADRVYG